MHLKLKSIITILICLLYPVGFSAQTNGLRTQTIRGIVTDRASGAPLSYVSIGLLDKPEIGVTADEDGKFVLNNVPVGRHTVQATFVGYEPSVYREILITSAKEVYLEIQMKENIKELDEVVIYSRTNKTLPLNEMATTGARMLSVEEASRYAGGMDDPARLVGAFAGVSPSVSNNGISIHGNAPHLLQWRLEDVEIPNPNHFADISTLGGGILSSFSSNVLGNSDFFTGAFPSEYSNAVSGVFDMKLRNGNNQKYENTFQLGILGIDFASEGPLSKKHNASYIFNYRYSTTSLLNLGGDLDYQDLNFKVNLPTKKVGIFSVWGTGLVDKIVTDFEEDPNKWEKNDDAKKSTAKQNMVSVGISHRYFFDNNTRWKTTIAATYFNHDAWEDIFDTGMNHTPYMKMERSNTNLVFTTSFNRKFNKKFTNKTGFTFTKMYYDMSMDLSPFIDRPMENITKGEGNTELISGYNSSSLALNDKISLNFGVDAQILTLNNSWTIEPRMGMKWQTDSKSSFALAYGLHSRMEKMDVYFAKTNKTGDKLVNKNLDFTKSHHIMFTYNYKISNDMNLRIEPYFQHLYNVPVMADSSYSVLNRNEFYVKNALVNKGKGRNVGVDITLEKYLTNGLYYMITGSAFNSKYCGGDGVWHNTKFNRGFILNTLIGKEWMLGSNKQNILSANLKFTLQGGDRYSPIDEEATMNHPDREVQYDENKAFSKQYSPMFIANATISYKINKKKVSHEFAIKTINLTGAKEYYGYEYNYKTDVIEKKSGSTSIPNVSYKINF